jgi:hypothetical protein
MRATRWSAVLFTALLGGVLAGLPATQATAEARAAAAAPATPTVGECRQLTPQQIQAPTDTTAAIPCSQRHDVRVIAVPTLPSGVQWSDLATARRIYSMAVSLCYSPYRKALGQVDRVRDRTAYTFLYFEPTKRQRAVGARWLRCDLALRHGTGWAALPTDQQPALSDATPSDGVARCLVTSTFLTTTCQARHQYRSTGTFTLTGRFPGRRALLHAGRSRCPSRVSTDTDFRFTWTPAPVWNLAHDHVVVCYSHTTS